MKASPCSRLPKMAVLVPLLLLVAVVVLCTEAANERRQLRIVNHSGKELAVEWINPVTGDLVTVTPSAVNDGQDVIFDSFVNHTFMVHEPSNKTDCVLDSTGPSSVAGSCAGSIIVVSEAERQVALVEEGLEVVFPMATPIHADFSQVDSVDECKTLIREQVRDGSLEASRALDAITHCLTQAASEDVFEHNDEIEFQSDVRNLVSSHLENHTCGNPVSETSEPIRTETWEHMGVVRNVGILHDRQSSQIHAIENFISPEECRAIEEAAAAKLHRGTVADGSGGHRLSDHRKAMQAGVAVPWSKEHNNDPIVAVMRRLYNYTNHAVGYNLTVDGQEDIMSIQYFGRGKNATESPDQYRPHCDGDCSGDPHKRGGRVATMVMYCDAPELGGGTNFQNSNVFVKPKVGAAAFFSYMNNETRHMETGFTSHSGCPVIEGVKRIAVHWMRIGVDRHNPWSSFNTLTISRNEAS